MIAVALLSLIVSVAGCLVLVRVGGLAPDIPNARSSHSRVIPRGAGLAIALAVLSASIVGLLEFPEALASESAALAIILGMAVVVGLLGILEDMRGVRAALRLGVEFCTAVVVSVMVVRWSRIGGGAFALDLPAWLGHTLTVFWIVWVVNLFNFMDGINGIAAWQAIVLGLCYLALGTTAGNLAVVVLGLTTAAAGAGFLPFNFPRARIFLGDSGSLFLGFVVAVLPLLLHRRETAFGFEMAVAVFAPFFFDATVTLCRRLMTGERVFDAHRSHCYQIFVDRGGNHALISLLYAGAGVLCGAAVLGAWRGNWPWVWAWLPAGGCLLVAVGTQSWYAWWRRGS